MPRYFIDTHDGTETVRDTIGVQFENVDQARADAVRALPDITRDLLPDGDKLVVSALVRDIDGQRLFQTSLTLKCEWLKPEKIV